MRELDICDLICNRLLMTPATIRTQWNGNTHLAIVHHDATLQYDESQYEHLAALHDAMLASQSHETSASSSAIQNTTSPELDCWQAWQYYEPGIHEWVPLLYLLSTLKRKYETFEVKTSQSHPFQIDTLKGLPYSGRLGLTACPGKQALSLYGGGRWQRNIADDVQAVADWGAVGVVSLIEPHEFRALRVRSLQEEISKHQLQWWHLPIRDMGTPNATIEAQWQEVGPQIHSALQQGKALVVHCRGGLGRTGLIAARVLIEAGVESEAAIGMVRQSRPGSIETIEQEEYVKGLCA